MSSLSDGVRARMSSAIFERIAGDEGADRRGRVLTDDGHRRFEPSDPIYQVHLDASMFVGGMRALLLQSLHPLAMAAVDQHSGFRGDPWGRLQRTSGFIAETTFGTDEIAQQAVDIVKAVHRHITGVAHDGRVYTADDPHLLLWVHVAEVDSFLRAHDRYGRQKLTSTERDTYVEQTAHVARALGSEEPPTTVAELTECLAAFRPELESTAAARQTARYLLVSAPVPWTLRPGYTMLATAAVGLMPRWTRLPLRLPYLPISESTAGRAIGSAATMTIRWAMQPPDTA